MNTATISAEINAEFVPVFKTLLKQFKAKSVKIEENDPAKMTQEAFFKKIDKARAGKKIKMSFDELEKLMME